jgi:excisionase family DNA binding protein
MKPLLSPKELADAIGVSESSVKRWVDSGIVHATKTAGGHRRIPINEAVRYLRDSQATLVNPESIGLSDVASLVNLEAPGGDEGEALYTYLREGQADPARGLMLSMFLNGRTVAQIVDGPLRSAMERLGELWREDDHGIFWEHRATEIVISAISRLRMLIPPRPEDAPTGVGGAPPGDPYILPTLCAAAVLESQGVNAVNLGADTPIHSLLLASQAVRAQLIWLSVSFLSDPAQLQHELQTLARQLSSNRVSIVIGGSQSAALRLPDSTFCHIGTSMRELEAMVKGLMVGAEGPATT